jgi:DNA-binding CsgD family transcriptional regulator
VAAQGTLSDLLERGDELEALRRLVDDAARGHGAACIVEGPAGIGKSALLQAAVAHARDGELRALVGRGSEFEGELAFGLARDLLEPALDGRRPPQPAADILARDAPVHAAEPQAPQRALLVLHRLVALLARDSPLLLCVDDAQWVDSASLRFLAFHARRLSQLPVALLVAVRSAGDGGAKPALGELLVSERDRILRPAPLSAAATATLVRSRWPGDATRELCDACHAATNGNPYLLGELLAALRQSGLDSAAQAIPRLLELGARAVAPMVLDRLGRLPPEAIELARAAAATGELGSAEELARLAGLDPATAPDSARRLADAELLASADELRFVHPLVRSAIRATMAPARRTSLGRAAARELAGAGDVEASAACLLDVPPRGDAWSEDVLVRAAGMARARGAPDVAVTLLRRALAEPPPPERRGRVLAELGAAQLAFGEGEAIANLRAALELADDPRERAALAPDLAGAYVRALRVREAVEVLDGAIAGLRGSEPGLAAELESTLLYFASWDPGLRPLVVERLGALAGARPRPGDGEPAARRSLVALALESIAQCRPVADGIALIERALAGGTLLRAAPVEHCGAALLLTMAGRPDLARTHLEEGLTAARDDGNGVVLRAALMLRSHAALAEGSVVAADLDAWAALDVGDEADPGAAVIVWMLIDCLLERGRVAESEAALRRYQLTGPLPGLAPFNAILHARGRVRIAAGSALAGLEDVLLAGERQEAVGQRNPALMPWRATAVGALLETGDRAQALALARENLELARAFGAAHVVGPALRALGRAQGEDGGLDALREAVELLDGSFARLELARARTDLGLALHEGGDRAAARAELAAAAAAALDLGATVLHERAAAAAIESGARPRGRPRRGAGALTAAERRVSELASRGATNPEIAAALFVTVKTVETHLSRCYRKLGISSRSQLPAGLVSDEDWPTPRATP